MVTRKKRLLLWWGRSGMALRVTVFLALAFLLSLLVYWQRPQEESPYLGRNVLVFILVNLNIVVLCVLAFLIGRNIVKLIFDRRRNILGSKLKLRLVTAFVGLTLIPTIFLFLLASGLLNRAMEGWFSSQVEASVSGAVEVAKYHYASMKESVLASAESIARELEHGHSLSDKAALESWFEDQRKADRLFGIKLVSQSHRVIIEVHNAAAVIPAFSEPDANEEALDKAISQNPSVLFEENEASQFVRAYLPVRMEGKNLVLITTLRVNPDLSQALSGVNDSYKEYEQLKLFKAPLKSGYLLTLAMITGLILFSAIWIGFYIAREMAVPIQRLAEGTRAVARGDYDFQIRERGDDELAFLVKSFNTMTSDLRQSRKEAQQRRLYIETILAN
ncbi:MAG: HAMP domain-containing protein, partial [Deltaproteobacteria bacterium]|nr:HAMP domain-containing protein [Deltaproteobacteria bacterium]